MPELEAEKYLRYNNNYYNVTDKHNFERYFIDGALFFFYNAYFNRELILKSCSKKNLSIGLS